VDLSPYRAFFARLDPQAHGDLPRWWRALAVLPEIRTGTVVPDAPCVGAESDPPPGARVSEALRTAVGFSSSICAGGGYLYDHRSFRHGRSRGVV
jgi:hypothetical protein